MRPVSVLLLLAVLLFIIAAPSLAIHEDEQGLRDWVLRFVGYVEHAAFQPGPAAKYAYVASKPGAVAAVSLSSGELEWRVLFSEPQVCVAAASNGVLVSSRTGTVYLLNAASGAIEATFKLSLPAAARVESCAIVDGNIMAAAMNATAVLVYKFDLTADDEMIMPSKTFSAGADAHTLRISGSHLWVFRSESADRYSLTGGEVEVSSVVGKSGHVSPTSGDAVVFSPSGTTLVRDAGKTENIVCDNSNCDAGVILNAAGKFGGVVKTTTDKSGFTVSFPKSNVHCDYNSTSPNAPRIFIAVGGGGEGASRGAKVILQMANGHLVGVSEESGKIWERQEGLAHLSATIIVDDPVHEDHFSFKKLALSVSTYGVVYSIPVSEMGQNIRVLADISNLLLQKTGVNSMESVIIEQIFVSGTNSVTIVASSHLKRVSVTIDSATGSIKEVKTHEDSLLVTPALDVTRSLRVHGRVPSKNMHFFTANVSSGLIEGYAISSTSTAVSLWTVRIPYPIVAYATGENVLRTTIVNQLRVFPNKTSKTDEVRRKYPTRNVLTVAHYEPSEEELSTLVVTAIDSITGSILATVRHRNVEGPVHMLIVEHTVVYYYMDMEKMRHCLGVWEMFEEEPGQVLRKDAGATLPQVIASFFFRSKRTFSSRATRPPTVTVAVLGVYGGDLATMGVTTSFNGIAKKNILLAFDSGRIAMVELDKLLAGGQVPLDDKGNQVTHAIIPSTSFASHKFRVAKPNLIATTPTNLESSCHVLVSGLDLFYVRASSGKAFDLLNSDFNKNLLVTLTCGFGVLMFVARYLVQRKAFRMLWS